MKFEVRRTVQVHTLAFALVLFPGCVNMATAQSTSSSRIAAASGKVTPASVNAEFDHEDLASLSIEKSDLVAQKPINGGVSGTAEFTRELWQVRWRLNDSIDLYVIRPKGVEKPPVILYLYSYPDDTDRFKDDGYCARATRGGYAAVGFVSALTGQRYHDRAMKSWFVSELPEALVKSTHDVQMILNYLATRDDLETSHVGMVAAGSGATIAILAASVDQRIQALDLLNPWADWSDWVRESQRIPDPERANYTTPEFLKAAAPFDPIAFIGDDVVTPDKCRKKLEAAAPHPSSEIVRYDTTRAFLDAFAGGKHFAWIKEHVGPSSAAATTQQASQ
jgi:dienelactone hydrolase